MKLTRWPWTEESETVNIDKSFEESCSKGEQKNITVDWREVWHEVLFSFVH